MSVTAVVLSNKNYRREWPGLVVLPHYSLIRTPVDFLAARVAAAKRVRTSHFFYLDDDDDLPSDYLSVIDDCVKADAAVAYTDRLTVLPEGFSYQKGCEYSQAAHLQNLRLTHQLAVFKTDVVNIVLPSLPVGNYYPELVIGWQVAKWGAAYVPRIGYHWRPGAMHNWPQTSISQTRAALWCRQNP